MIALVVAALCFFPCGDFAQVAKASAKGSASTRARIAGRQTTQRSGKSSMRRTRVRSRGRESRARRFARLKFEPQRIEEIQRALASAGFLNQEPNGVWDPATRDAMRRYQAENGFPKTGLPEARSLMKLGLGPHPLPEELDPASPARASTQAPVTAGSPSPDTSNDPPAAGSPY